MERIFFYKYRIFNINTVRTIVNSEVYFSSPNDFNDPFDCQIPLIYSSSEQEWKDQLINEYRKRLPTNTPENQIKHLIEKQFSGKDIGEEIKKLATKEIENALKHVGIYCLSKAKNNILMYSHYADNHRGVCLEFSGIKGTMCSHAKKVIYKTSFPRVKFIDSDFRTQGEVQLLTKSSFWKYEKEYRILDFGEGPQIYNFHEEELTGIILGSKFPKPKYKLLRNLCKCRTKNIKIYEAKVNPNKFALDIKLVEEIINE